MIENISLEITSDGTPTIYCPNIDEHYHSIYGARIESEHIFINQGLKNCEKKHISILEIGLGTGLNLMLTMLNRDEKKISYDAIERYPVPPEMVAQIISQYTDEEQRLLKIIHDSEWNKRYQCFNNFDFLKIAEDIATITFPQKYDVVYYDAFSPEKQPQLWTEELFHRIYDAMNVGGRLVTYCSKGLVKQNLRAVGFNVVRKQGPPHKHHMLVAIK